MLEQTLKNARILMVDDQEANLLVLTDFLERDGYTDLRSVADPRQVLPLFPDFQPDIILLDLHMPHLDGFAVMEGLRQRIPADEYLPILVLTADITPDIKIRALAEGARDFLAKPLDAAEVNLRVKNLLETRFLHLQQKDQNAVLEKKVRERTAELELQLERLSALRLVDMAINSTTDLRLSLNTVVDQAVMHLQVDAADILLFNPYTLSLEYSAGLGFYTNTIGRSSLRLGEDAAGRAALERKFVSLHNLKNKEEFSRTSLAADEGFTCYWCAPLIAKGELKGVLEAYNRSHRERSPDWEEFLQTLAGQASIAIDNASLFENLYRANAELTFSYDATIEGWSRAMDLRDKETEGHTRRVTDLTLKLARASGMTTDDLIQVKRGALLHDMGKLGVPDSILLKPGKLTEEEWAVMRKHPQFAYDMLSPIPYLKPALDIPYCHHEKWDGTGYPRGLKGGEIPLAARLFAVVDVWDALRSDRPYRPAWSEEETLGHIRSLAGNHFDPQAVELFLKVVGEET